MTREDKRAYNYATNRLANDDYPVYSDEYELKLAYKAGIEDAKNHPHWISVEDELSPLNEDVIVCFGVNQEVAIDRRIQKIEDNGYVDWELFVGITHWMPLPQAPMKGD